MLPVTNTQISGFTGEKSVRIKRQILLPITIENVTKNISFLIVPKLAKQCILGIDALTSFNTIVDLMKRQLLLRDHEESSQITVKYEIQIDTCNEEIANVIKSADLDEKSKDRLIEICVRHKQIFRKIPGRFSSYEHHIAMKETEPFAIKSYPVPIKYRDQVSEQIEQMLKYGVIERSTTPFINPLVVVPKRDNSVRICLDARQINEKMIEDHDGSEEIDQVLRRCNTIGVMSSIDLRSSFWQVPLAKESRQYTGFLHQGKTYQYTVVPFGLKISSSALNRAAEHVLKGLENKVIAFVDDWLIISPNIDEHLKDIDELFTRIEREGVTVNLSKFEPARKEIKFVGFILTPQGLSIDKNKVSAIHEYPTPRNATEVKGFLGLINFNSRFTSQLAACSTPLIELTKKETEWRWTKMEQDAFEATKQLFCDKLTLAHPIKGKSYILYTDASNIALGAALCQEVDEGDIRIVYLASRTLKGAEKNYFTTELELLAIVWAVNKFRSYIQGYKVEVRTDHQALTYLKTCRFVSQRLLRWSLAIQDYNVSFKFVPGKENVLADVLSRLPQYKQGKDNGPAIFPILTRVPDKELMRDLQNIRQHQEEDDHLRRLVRKGDPKMKIDKNGIRTYHTNDGKKVYLPRILLDKFISEIHQLYGHIGPRKVTAMISEDFYWPNLIKRASKILRTCDSCQRNKVHTQPIVGLTQPMLPTKPNELLSIDFIGPFPAGIRDYRYILVTVDVFSKMTQLYPIVSATSHITFNRIVNDYFKRFGKVEKIQSDRGSQFTSKAWQTAMKNQGVQVIFSAIRHPQSNLVERYNKEIGRFLRTLVGQNHHTWSVWCSLIAETINSTINETTGFTPWELHTGQRPARIWKHIVKCRRRKFRHDHAIKKARERMKYIGNRRAARHNQRAKITEFRTGELVLVKALRVASSAKQTVAKLLSLYEGPYMIAKKVSIGTYELKQPHTGKVRGRYHASSLKPYFTDGPTNYPSTERAETKEDSGGKETRPCYYPEESENQKTDLDNPRKEPHTSPAEQGESKFKSAPTTTSAVGEKNRRGPKENRRDSGRTENTQAKAKKN
ncbi:hypothetical protein TKK_0013812 [Trichogramma kaykai]